MITNTGDLGVAVTAVAVGSGTGIDDAHAVANIIGAGILQNVSGETAAAASIVNSGTSAVMGVSAKAFADAIYTTTSGEGDISRYGSYATADVNVQDGISQNASGYSNATAKLTNNGSIGVDVGATAWAW